MASSGVNLGKYRIPLEEIIRATNNFSPETRIGDGGYGVVYKGQLSDRWENRIVAIKRLDRSGYQGNNEFQNELEMVSSFQHPNIIAFIGYCDEANEMIIVYEYAISGSLDHQLQNPNKRRFLTWAQRLKICLGAARGLEYLHSGLGEHKRVIHRDVKSGNILLDENLEAKICDFGLSRFGPRNQPHTKVITRAAGTRFYMDPVYSERGILSKESDIYSFGVVLFEMSSGMMAYHGRGVEDSKPQNLIHLVRCYYEDDRLDGEPDNGLDMLIDPLIKGHINMISFNMFNEIAHQCINIKLKERPTLDKVITTIEYALIIQDANRAVIECDQYIMKDTGFNQGKPTAAFTIYECLQHWKLFEVGSTKVFDQLIQIIDLAIKKEHNNDYTVYWSSNALALLFFIHGYTEDDTSKSMGLGSSRSVSLEKVQQVEGVYPNLHFKQKLTAYIEKMYATISDNLKEELRSSLTLCIEDPETSNDWQGIVDCLTTILDKLEENFVPCKIAQKIFAQLFSYINIELFNSILLYPESCNFSTWEYMQYGLQELDIWCSKASKKYVGSASKNLTHIREAVELLVSINSPSWKPTRKVFEYLCPSLTLQQLYRICTLYPSENTSVPILTRHICYLLKAKMTVVSESEDDNSFILEDNLSHPFSVKELLNSCKAKYFAGAEPVAVFTKYMINMFSSSDCSLPGEWTPASISTL